MIKKALNKTTRLLIIAGALLFFFNVNFLLTAHPFGVAFTIAIAEDALVCPGGLLNPAKASETIEEEPDGTPI